MSQGGKVTRLGKLNLVCKATLEREGERCFQFTLTVLLQPNLRLPTHSAARKEVTAGIVSDVLIACQVLSDCLSDRKAAVEKKGDGRAARRMPV